MGDDKKDSKEPEWLLIGLLLAFLLFMAMSGKKKEKRAVVYKETEDGFVITEV